MDWLNSHMSDKAERIIRTYKLKKRGLSIEDISRIIGVNESTIESYLKDFELYKKLHAKFF